MVQTRTNNSVKNARYALVFFIINTVLSFYSRRIFISVLGAELLGLNSTLSNILNFLNISELGISTAISFSLYKPIFENDNKTVGEIVSVEGFWYKRIAIFIFCMAIIISLFFPLIFAKTNISLPFIYATFYILLLGSMLSYLFNYKQILLSAYQKEYKITLNRQGWIAIKLLLQIIAINLFNNAYIYWLIIEFIYIIVNTVSLNRMINNEYPWLNIYTRKKNIKELSNKHSILIIKTKQVFFHQIGSLFIEQTTPIIIYSYVSLTMVTIYGNYIMIKMGIVSMFAALFSGIVASIGNLIAEGDKKKTMSVFWELFSGKFFLSTIACYMFWQLSDSFIYIWVGRDFILDEQCFWLFLTIMFIGLVRHTVDNFINAYGIFQDIYAPIIEIVINIVISVTLGYYWGLAGILSGMLACQIIIVFMWKPFFLFRYGLKEPVHRYFTNYAAHIVVSIAAIILTNFFLNGHISITNDISIFLFSTIKIFIIFSITLFLFMYVAFRSMRNFVKRIQNVIYSFF